MKLQAEGAGDIVWIISRDKARSLWVPCCTGCERFQSRAGDSETEEVWPTRVLQRLENLSCRPLCSHNKQKLKRGQTNTPMRATPKQTTSNNRKTKPTTHLLLNGGGTQQTTHQQTNSTHNSTKQIKTTTMQTTTRASTENKQKQTKHTRTRTNNNF